MSAYEDVFRTELGLRGYRLLSVSVGRHVFWSDWRLVTLFFEDLHGLRDQRGDVLDVFELRDDRSLRDWVDTFFPDLLADPRRAAVPPVSAAPSLGHVALRGRVG